MNPQRPNCGKVRQIHKHSLLQAGFALALLSFVSPALALKLQDESDFEYVTYTDEAGVDYTGEKVDLLKYLDSGSPPQVIEQTDTDSTFQFTVSSGALEFSDESSTDPVWGDEQIIKVVENDEDGDEQFEMKNDSEVGTGIAPDSYSYDLSDTRNLLITSDKQPVMIEYDVADEYLPSQAQVMKAVENLA